MPSTMSARLIHRLRGYQLAPTARIKIKLLKCMDSTAPLGSQLAPAVSACRVANFALRGLRGSRLCRMPLGLPSCRRCRFPDTPQIRAKRRICQYPNFSASTSQNEHNESDKICVNVCKIGSYIKIISNFCQGLLDEQAGAL